MHTIQLSRRQATRLRHPLNGESIMVVFSLHAVRRMDRTGLGTRSAFLACAASLLGSLVCIPAYSSDFDLIPSTEGRTYVVPYEAAEARFTPLYADNPNSPQISVLWGNPQTGPSAALFRFPLNYGGRFHSHSAAYHLSLMEGTMKHWDEGQLEADVPIQTAGAYWYQPGGQLHSDNCLSEFCVAFVVFDGAIDSAYAD